MKRRMIQCLVVLLGALSIVACEEDGFQEDLGSGKFQQLQLDIKNQPNLSTNEKLAQIDQLAASYAVDANVAQPDTTVVQGAKPIIQKQATAKAPMASKELSRTLCTATVRKEISGDIQRPYVKEYEVAPITTLAVTARPESGVDSVAVLYTIQNGNFGDYRLQADLNVLDYNDDTAGLGLGSQVSYYNPYRSPVKVVVLVYPYSKYSTGATDITVTNGGTTTTENYSIGGIAQRYDNASFDAFTGENQTVNDANYWGHWAFTAYANGMFAGVDNGPYSTGDSWIWAFNFNTMKGASNDDYNTSTTHSEIDSVGALIPPADQYNSVILLGGFSNYGEAKMWQVNGYCPQ